MAGDSTAWLLQVLRCGRAVKMADATDQVYDVLLKESKISMVFGLTWQCLGLVCRAWSGKT